MIMSFLFVWSQSKNEHSCSTNVVFSIIILQWSKCERWSFIHGHNCLLTKCEKLFCCIRSKVTFRPWNYIITWYYFVMNLGSLTTLRLSVQKCNHCVIGQVQTLTCMYRHYMYRSELHHNWRHSSKTSIKYHSSTSSCGYEVFMLSTSKVIHNLV